MDSRGVVVFEYLQRVLSYPSPKYPCHPGKLKYSKGHFCLKSALLSLSGAGIHCPYSNELKQTYPKNLLVCKQENQQTHHHEDYCANLKTIREIAKCYLQLYSIKYCRRCSLCIDRQIISDMYYFTLS